LSQKLGFKGLNGLELLLFGSDLYGFDATLIYLATGQHPVDLPQANLQLEFDRFANY